MLDALRSFEPSHLEDLISLRPPRLYHFVEENAVAVMEDFRDLIDLKSILTSASQLSLLSYPCSTLIGKALGQWLRSFHIWASAPAQETVRDQIRKNEPMKMIKSRITYERILEVLEIFPNVLEGYQDTVQAVMDMAAGELAKKSEMQVGSDWGVIHGDFWSGK